MKRPSAGSRPLLGVIALVLTAALAVAAPAAGAVAPSPAARPLPNLDTRERDSGPVAPAVSRARSALEDRLGDEGVVRTDRVSGAVRLVARTDGFLTPRSIDDPSEVALDYVRARNDVFALDGGDLGGLRPTGRYRSADGVTHLTFTQTARGVAAYDNALLANVARDGRLLNAGGSAVPDLAVASVQPAIPAGGALAAARANVAGSMIAPRPKQETGAERPTQFAGGDRARLTIFGDGVRERLAWRVLVTGEHGFRYEVVVDAASAAILLRRSLTEFVSQALVYDYHPGADSGGTAHTVDLDAAPTWLDRSSGFTRLRGNNAHAYADTAGDGFDPGEDIPPSTPAQWVYPQEPFDVPGQPCPLVVQCTWDSTEPSTKAANRNQVTTQLFYLVNAFHDHLKAPPIGFTHAARGFEFTDADGPAGPGLGADPVNAEANDFSALNNANMATPPDGAPPTMQMFFFGPPDAASLNSGDAADVVFHEYTHGLTSRSLGTGAGVSANQSRAMGEGWSDWYALDFLVSEGHITDSTRPGELTIGAYLIAGGFRRQGADCPVGPATAACPGAPGAGPGGFTFGDLGKFAGASTMNPLPPHANGEIWLETLWDLRRQFGSQTARELITGGLRLAPNDPTYLEARDAIIQADQALGGNNYNALWTLFAARGMGYSATTASSMATSAVEAFDLPPALSHVAATITDPAPGGDADAIAEPGETVRVSESLRNANSSPVTGVSGLLTTSTPGAVVVGPAATWPDFPAVSTQTGTPAFGVAIGSSVACGANVQLSLQVATAQGNTTVPLTISTGVGPAEASTDVPKAIPDDGGSPGVSSAIEFTTPGTVSALKVRVSRLVHTFVGDLEMTLRSPGGRTVTLMSSPGSGTFGARGNDFTDLVLDDGAPTAIEAIAPDNPPGGYSGSFRPDQPLSAFDGEQRLGVWTLNVSDSFLAEDSGTLHGWGLVPLGRSCSVPDNGTPVADADAYSVEAGATLDASSVLANDSDSDGDALSAVKTSNPSHGTVALAADGTFTYTPAAGFSGADSFTYVAYDGTTVSAAGTVAITVKAATTPPPAPSPPPPPPPAPPPPPRPPPGPPAPPPPPAVLSTPRVPAKLEVARAVVRRGRLDVLARITALAAGTVKVSYRSSGVTTRFSVPIATGTVRFNRRLPRAQRAKSTGILTLTYGGSARVHTDGVTLRAALRSARLVRSTARIDDQGRLRVAGTITSRARGVVRVRLGYVNAADTQSFLDYSAKIAGGKWSLSEALPTAVAASGGQLSIQFTGYEPRRIRGEQDAKAVRPPG